MANRAFKYRLYPNKNQQIQFNKTFGCVRFTYNHCLNLQQERYAAGQGYMSKTGMNNYCNRILKDDYPFLKEVDKFALTNAVYHLDAGFQRMFQHRGKHPKFKSKHKSRASYTTNFTNGNIKVLDGRIQLPKIGKVKAVIHRTASEEYALKSATVSMEKDHTYYVSILYEYEEKSISSMNSNAVGLDYKSDGLYKTSNGDTCNMPHYFRKSQPALVKAQRKLKHKVKGSNNWVKQQKKIARVHRHIANQRKDYLHKKSTEIVNQYGIVCVEDLDMKAISNKGFRNGKATMDNGYGMFLNMLEYKLHDRGGKLVKVDKWYPSSQICCQCGSRQVLSLSDRLYCCPVCGMELDRDHNAAINIKEEGLRILRNAS